MARLTHNDYLEQFSDSGVPAGLAYLIWISLALTRLFKTIWSSDDFIPVAMLMGLLGWFLQGLGEFSLYIPALAWTAFTLLGCLIGQKINQFDK
jgi:O-antigen ligase